MWGRECGGDVGGAHSGICWLGFVMWDILQAGIFSLYSSFLKQLLLPFSPVSVLSSVHSKTCIFLPWLILHPCCYRAQPFEKCASLEMNVDGVRLMGEAAESERSFLFFVFLHADVSREGGTDEDVGDTAKQKKGPFSRGSHITVKLCTFSNPYCLQLMSFSHFEKHANGDFWFRDCNYEGS